MCFFYLLAMLILVVGFNNIGIFVEAYPVFKKYIPDTAGKILELATGCGRFGVSIAKDFKNSKVYVSDILEESLDLARNLADELDVRNIEFSVQDCLHISFEDNYFDVVFADGVIQLFTNHIDAVSEMVRVLKPGGTLIVAVPNFWNFHTLYKSILPLLGRKFEYDYEKSFKKSELRKAFKDTGLHVQAEDGFYVGYGLFRLKRYHKMFHFWGRAINRLSKILDRFTERFFTRNFGFEIVIVGKK
ncbi:MAG: Demethylmenaquinone methyltransferase [Candidatus Yanofskybacteria bacterium GW2011_GWA2_44_10]|nr:MAG: Demethylmenaquinone methyltransferase [Candidatus Yanofskybacteria bacterium GW2011_GWA2_44_10]